MRPFPLAAIAILACLLASCRNPGSCTPRAALMPPVSSSLPAAEKKSLLDALARLDKVLLDKAPSLHARIAPGATAEIADLRTALGGAVVEPLELWFRWHNGARGGFAQLLPLGELVSVAEAVRDRTEVRRVAVVPAFRKNVLMILHDGAGDGFFLDVTSTRPLVYHYMIELGGPRSYGTLTEFVTFIADTWDRGIVYLDAAGRLAYDDARYVAFEKVHFARTTKP